MSRSKIEMRPVLGSINLGDGDLGDNPAMLRQLRDGVRFTSSHLRQTDRPEGWKESVASGAPFPFAGLERGHGPR